MLPKELTPSKNWTFVTVPSRSLAVAAMIIVAGAVKDAAFVGLVMLTVGGELETTVTVTEAEVVVAPKLSDATAVNVLEPRARPAEMP